MEQGTAKPVLIFDGDCGFCRRWIAGWKEMTGEKVEYAPYQEAGSRYPGITEEQFRRSVHLIEEDGRRSSGAKAVFKTLAYGGRRGWLWAYEKIPGFAPLAEVFYRLVAANRVLFSQLTLFFFGSEAPEQNYRVSRWVFLRGLGLVYAVAFWSFDIQLDGLIGENGILPARDFLNAVAERFGAERFYLLPTFAWIHADNAFLHLICRLGIFFSACLSAGLLPVVSAIFLWAAYLSLVGISRDFLGFQWDILLIETGFLALFLQPLHFWKEPPVTYRPPRAVLFLFCWLVFRLMFSSGFVKLSSGDPAWRHLTALSYHYETQPLPAWTSWYVHQLSPAFQRFCTGTMFCIELVFPFFIFGPHVLRRIGAFGLIGLQAVIMMTGNYCFFNLLSILLCLFLIDDGIWGTKLLKKIEEGEQAWDKLRVPAFWKSSRARPWPRFVLWPAAACLFLLSLNPFSRTLDVKIPWPAPVRAMIQAAYPFHLTSGYGLFAVMTTERPEITVQGSLDGTNWKSYEFKYKPGDLSRSPVFVEPHQPRLDWQMWFAALGGYQNNPWFMNFCARLMQGSPDVLKLLKSDPFSGAPPRYIRALISDYRFTDAEERSRTGHYWKKGPEKMYLPAISLRR
ncbi:MAG TPA: lipase maturation factor family protein [Verrucomicrobiae bacterium]|jgi:predicted DCC family thiol-disulfide oxidoreductase YuxK|nr:lipase maturation factor family protein [Verrucomicrobiae bacterium]